MHRRGFTNERRGECSQASTALAGLLLAAAIASPLAGCGGSARQHQATTMMAAQHDQVTTDGGGTTATAAPAGVGVVTPGLAPSTSNLKVDPSSYRLGAGDVIDVKFPYQPELSERMVVRPDGRIDLQIAGDVPAAGHTVKELEDVLVEKTSVTLRQPVVSVVIAQIAEHKVYVGGQVSKPGFVAFREGLTPLQAILERGGFTDEAKTDSVVYLHRTGEEVETERLDLASVIDGNDVDEIPMAPDDVIIVPRTFIGNADVFVDQWVRGLLPSVPRPGLDLNSL